MSRRRSAVPVTTASRPLRFALAFGLVATLLGLFALASSSPRSGGFALFPPSHYRLAIQPKSFLLNETAPIVGERPAALLPILAPHNERPDRRLAHLERLEVLDAKLGGFGEVGLVVEENVAQIELLRQCLEEGRWGGRCSHTGEGAKVVLVGFVLPALYAILRIS